MQDYTMEILPSPFVLHQEIPITLADRDFVIKSRNELAAILSGKDPRTALIVGPCSLHDVDAALEYGEKLKKLAEEVKESYFIIMRAHFEKPRTSIGWKGLLHDPDLDGTNNLVNGIKKSRSLLKSLTQLRIPLGTEILDPSASVYFGDLVTWGCIGARTTSSQVHRQIASHLPFPVAFKNTTDGNIETALNGIEVAKQPQKFLGINLDGHLSVITSSGNSFCHLVLRGSELEPNFEASFVAEALNKTPYLIVDCSHDNSGKNPRKQLDVFSHVMDQILQGNRQIKGLMLESFLYEGNQPARHPLKYGVSVTDACLDFEMTQHLIREKAAQLQLCATPY